jgi:hypothetical protein
MAAIHPQTSLQEALNTLNRTEAEVLYVSRPVAPKTERIFGVVLRQDIESAYQSRTVSTI